MAHIICGANELEDERWDGKTVEQVKAELGRFLNIPDDCKVLLNGEEIDGTNVALRSGDQLEFVKHAGSKGKGKA